MRRTCIVLVASGSIALAAGGATAPPAQANIVCGAAGLVSGLLGKACGVVSGPVGGIVKKVLGGGGSSAGAAASRGLAIGALAASAVLSAHAVIKIVAKAISASTSPRLTSTWFSARYWRVTAIAALLALPFLFAAAVQALMRSDLTLLLRAAFAYLPLAVLATAIAAPLTMLLLAGSDEMSSIVSSAATGGHHFLRTLAYSAAAFAIAKDSPFLLISLAMVAIAFGLAVWFELAVREAAVYVIVLMLPLMFSAMVWPARRVWAIRAVETLVALILSKFVIVAVLSLGSGALGHGGIVSAISGIALLMLAAFSPWMLLRLLPMAELAGAAAGGLGETLRARGSTGVRAATGADPVSHVRQAVGDLTGATTAWMRNQASGDGDVHTSRAGGYAGGGGAMANPTASGGGATANGTSGAAPAPTGASGGAAPPTGATANGATANGATANGASGERSPGLNPAFQTADDAHRAVALGPDEYDSGQPSLAYQPEPGAEPDTGEHHEPLPERQPDLESE